MKQRRQPGHRRATRQTPRFPAASVQLRSRHLEARLINLSRGGAAIESSEQPRIGAAVVCELETDHTAALLEGEVLWCNFAGTSNGNNGDVHPVYRAGIRFTNGSPRNLLRIVRSLGLKRPESAG